MSRLRFSLHLNTDTTYTETSPPHPHINLRPIRRYRQKLTNDDRRQIKDLARQSHHYLERSTNSNRREMTYISSDSITSRTIYIPIRQQQTSPLEEILRRVLECVYREVLPVRNYPTCQSSSRSERMNGRKRDVRRFRKELVDVLLFSRLITQYIILVAFDKGTEFGVGIAYFACSAPYCRRCCRVRDEFLEFLLGQLGGRPVQEMG